MGGRREVQRRQSTRTKFKNADMDFSPNLALGVSQILGLSPGEVLAAISTVGDGDPGSWRERLYRQARYLSQRADGFEIEGSIPAAAHSAFGAAYARRFALHFEEPGAPSWAAAVAGIEQEFTRATNLHGPPIRAVEVPFDGSTLPGYYLEIDDAPRPTLLIVGGSDTFREDLFYYGGYPGGSADTTCSWSTFPARGRIPPEDSRSATTRRLR